MSDCNLLVARRDDGLDELSFRARYEATDRTLLEALGIIADLRAANHVLTVKVAEREETIAALRGLRVVREEDWLEKKFDSEGAAPRFPKVNP